MAVDRVQWKLLQELNHNFTFYGLAHGGLTLKQIAQRCGVEVPRIEWLVKRLQLEGLIWRSTFIEGVEKIGITYEGSKFVNQFVFQDEILLGNGPSEIRRSVV